MFFKESKKSFLGVDIGASNIKLVELLNDDHIARLRTYGYVEHDVDIIRNDDSVSFDKIVEALKFITKKSKASSTKVITSLPNYSTFSSIVNISAMDKKDLTEAIKIEAKKFIPIPLKDVVLNWQILEDGKNNNIAKREITTNYKILLTAAPKNIVNKFINIFKAAGLELITLDIESFAIVRSLMGNDPSVSMICNIGDSISSVYIIKGGVPIISRSIDFGGSKIDRNIANALNIDISKAEQFKEHQGLSGDLESGVSKIIIDSLQPMFDEIKYTLSIFQNQSTDILEKIILTGGTSSMIGLPAYIGNKFNKRAYIGNPWSRIEYPEELFPALEEIGSKFAISVGLAQREAEK